MRNYRFAILPVLMLLSSACKEMSTDIPLESGSTPLELKFKTGIGNETKALVTGNALSNGSEVGVYLYDDSGISYDGIPYSNIRYTAGTTSGQQTWSSDKQVMLSATKADLYAYYPYSDEVSSINSIRIVADSENQTDYMYATPSLDLSNHNASAEVTLNHALAAVRLSLSRGTYSGTGEVTSISIRGNGIATSGILDAVNGEITSTEGTGTAISPAFTAFTLSSQAEDTDILVIPDGNSSEIIIDIVIDGENFTTVTDNIQLEQGKLAIYGISVNNGGVSVSGMKVRSWDNRSIGNAIVSQNYSINIEGNTDGITISDDISDDNVVTLTAVPDFPEDAEVNPISFEGEAAVVQSLNDDTGVLTVTISDIRSDINICFNSISLWVTTTYQVNNTETSTKLYNSVNSNDPIRMKIDGTETEVKTTHIFNNIGEHKVKFAFSDYKTIKPNVFQNTKNIISANFPEGIESLGNSIFQNCTNLTSVSLPESLKGIGYSGFDGCRKLLNIFLPEGIRNLYSNTFCNCSSLEEIILPSGLTTIPQCLFQDCLSLRKVSIPQGITRIGESAFQSTSLETIELPSGLEYIGTQAFFNMYELESITCHAETAPELGMNVFSFYNGQSGIVYVPSGSEDSYNNIWFTDNSQLKLCNWEIKSIN